MNPNTSFSSLQLTKGTVIPVEKQQWSIKREISAGDLVAIVVALVSVLSAYFMLNRDQALTNLRVQNLEQLRAADSAQNSNTLSDIRSDIRRLVERLDRYLEKR